MRALAAARSVADGPVILNESIELVSSILSPRSPRARFAGDGELVLWWHSNLAGVRQLARSAGLDVEDESGMFFIPWGEGYQRPGPGPLRQRDDDRAGARARPLVVARDRARLAALQGGGEPAAPPGEREDAREAIARIPWYHTLELPGGLETAGWVDCRPVTDRVLAARRHERDAGPRRRHLGRVLGLRDGAPRRRGVTVDIPDPAQWDWPPRMYLGEADATRRQQIADTNLGEGYRLAHELLGSSVVQERVSVYELDAEQLGTFDIVVVGSILLHLRDPVAALAAIRPLARGPVVLNEAIELIPVADEPAHAAGAPRGRQRRAAGGSRISPRSSTWPEAPAFACAAGTRPFFVPLGAGHPPRPSRSRQIRGARAAGDPRAPDRLVARDPRTSRCSPSRRRRR